MKSQQKKPGKKWNKIKTANTSSENEKRKKNNKILCLLIVGGKHIK